jgi:hypothetical protein
MENQKLKEILKLLNTYSHPSKRSEAESRRRVASDGSQPSPFQEEEDRDELLSVQTLEYHLTVQTSMELSRKNAGLLLAVLNYQATHFGLNFGMWMGIEYLVNLLLGKKLHPTEIKDKMIRDVVFAAYLILMSIDGDYLNLWDFSQVPSPLVQKLEEEGLLMTKRTYGSRFSTYRPELLLKISTVPVNIRFERQKGNSNRYSSYCKGYGESHPSAHRQKTKPSFELDGEQDDKDFLNLREISNLLVLTQLEVWTKFHKSREKKT